MPFLSANRKTFLHCTLSKSISMRESETILYFQNHQATDVFLSMLKCDFESTLAHHQNQHLFKLKEANSKHHQIVVLRFVIFFPVPHYSKREQLKYPTWQFIPND